MNNNAVVSLTWPDVESQSWDVRELSDSLRDTLIVSATQVDGHCVVISRYGDDSWHLDGVPSNKSNFNTYLKFKLVPAAFRAVMKAIMYRYLRRGREGQQRPKGSALINFLNHAVAFLRYLDALALTRLALVTPIVCTNYAAECREYRHSHHGKSKPLSQGSLSHRFLAVEALYELSQYTHDPIPQHPWYGTSANAIAGRTGSGSLHKQGCKTPLMPDMVFSTLFQNAYEQVRGGQRLLDLRDAVASVVVERSEVS